MWESDMRYPHSNKPLKNEKSRDRNNFKAKKNHYASAVNNSGKIRDQLCQTLGRYSKNNFCLYKKDKVGQFCNTITSGNHVTIVKKNIKQDDKDLSQVECYFRHKNNYYATKSLDKEL